MTDDEVRAASAAEQAELARDHIAGCLVFLLRAVAIAGRDDLDQVGRLLGTVGAYFDDAATQLSALGDTDHAARLATAARLARSEDLAARRTVLTLLDRTARRLRQGLPNELDLDPDDVER